MELQFERIHSHNGVIIERAIIDNTYLLKIHEKGNHTFLTVPKDEVIIVSSDNEYQAMPKEFTKAVYNIVYGLDIYRHSAFTTVKEDTEFEDCLNVIKKHLPK